jgi:hypothetical protein
MDSTIRAAEREAASGNPEAAERLERLRRRVKYLGAMEIIIDGETLEVNDTREIGFGDLWELSTDDGDFIVSESNETAGAAARERWADMAENDPEEFRTMVGDESLIRWALGQSAGPGSVHVNSLSDWLDLTATVPEEEWASYDGTERDVEEVGSDIESELGYTPTVAYRCN